MSIARLPLINMFLAAIYLGFGFSALLGQDNIRQAFSAWGYPDWFRMLAGFVEVVAGGCLLVPPAVPAAAGVLAFIMLGAIGTHLRAGEAPFALIPLGLFLVLAWVGVRAWRSRPS